MHIFGTNLHGVSSTLQELGKLAKAARIASRQHFLTFVVYTTLMRFPLTAGSLYRISNSSQVLEEYLETKSRITNCTSAVADGVRCLKITDKEWNIKWLWQIIS